MTEKNGGDLPRQWLPDPVAPPDGGDADEWERRLQRLMRAAEPRLAELARTAEAATGTPRRTPADAALPWWAILVGRWKPALAGAALAAAVTVFGLRLLPGGAAGPAPAPDAFTLTAVTGGGEAAALWQGLGVEADPVLAHLVLEGGSP